MRGQLDELTLASNLLQFLCRYLEVQAGAIYLQKEGFLELIDSQAYVYRKELANNFYIGQGVVGQAAQEKNMIVLRQVPHNYVKIVANSQEVVPTNVVACPFLYEGQLIGVIELGSETDFTPRQVGFLQQSMENIAIAFSTAQARALYGNTIK
jgi:putative methionine-R-sulfoxide reductase with GAF domain